MIWIFLLYVLPLLITIVGGYWFVKKAEGTIKDFIEPLPFLFIPLFNIIAIIAGIYFLIENLS